MLLSDRDDGADMAELLWLAAEGHVLLLFLWSQGAVSMVPQPIRNQQRSGFGYRPRNATIAVAIRPETDGADRRGGKIAASKIQSHRCIASIGGRADCNRPGARSDFLRPVLSRYRGKMDLAAVRPCTACRSAIGLPGVINLQMYFSAADRDRRVLPLVDVGEKNLPQRGRF